MLEVRRPVVFEDEVNVRKLALRRQAIALRRAVVDNDHSTNERMIHDITLEHASQPLHRQPKMAQPLARREAYCYDTCTRFGPRRLVITREARRRITMR